MLVDLQLTLHAEDTSALVGQRITIATTSAFQATLASNLQAMFEEWLNGQVGTRSLLEVPL